MKMFTLKKLLYLLVVFAVILLLLPLVQKNFVNKDEEMKRHFRKASVYEEQTKNKSKVPIIPERAHKSVVKHFQRVAGGIKSIRNTLAPIKKTTDHSKQYGQLLNTTCQPISYTTYQTNNYCLTDDSFDRYFKTENNNKYCLREGTEFILDNGTRCFCRSRWHGSLCSMPDVVFKSNYPHEYGYMQQNPPRRLIHAFPFVHEFDMLETRFNEYGHLVDLYIIIESNYTASGQPKKRLLKEKLDRGEYAKYQSRILYVSLDYFPRKAFYDGWIIDALLRNHIAAAGLNLVGNLREDDVFLVSDADELASRELLLFLKLHMSYPEPVGMYLSHNVYGFQWLGEDITSHVFGACSISMLRYVFNWQPYSLRSATKHMQQHAQEVEHYRYKLSGRVHEWSAGTNKTAAGWHCSWCFTAAGIKRKLEAAHWSDLPRWGAYPSKTSEQYIHNLTMRGIWFDDRTRLIAASSDAARFAPEYILRNSQRFGYLLGNDSILT